MRNNNFLLILLLAVLILSIVINFSLIEKKQQTDNQNLNQIANPASVYCLKQGGRLDIRKDAEGNETGYCILPDGNECEEWAYYRRECFSQGFCGASLGGQCTDNADCLVSGCSSQLCHSKKILPSELITDCRYKDCYDAKKYNRFCACISNQCQWYQPK